MSQQSRDEDWAELAIEAARGDHHAFRRLTEAIWPDVVRLAAHNRHLLASGGSNDDARNVAVLVLEKLNRSDYRVLSLYEDWQARHPDKEFRDWLAIVVANTLRDYVRGAAQVEDGEDSPLPSKKRILNEFVQCMPSHEQSFRPPMTAAQTVRQLIEYAQTWLPQDQRRALETWLEGTSFEEMGAELGCDAETAKRLVRAAVASLRRRFASL